jgi:hypothetical protein
MYFWKIKSDWSWFIKKIATSNNSITYCFGTTDYSTNRTNRASLTYNIYWW